MKRFLMMACVLSPACVSNDPGGTEVSAAGWTALYNGKDLAGWVGGTTYDPEKYNSLSLEERGDLQAQWDAGVPLHWRADGEELVSDGAGPHLATEALYGDFELELDWVIQPGGDSGIYLRGYPQVQIWDPANPKEQKNGADQGSGGLWNNDAHERFPEVCADAPPGQWNRMRVRMRGAEVDVWLNAQHIVRGVELDNYFRRGSAILERGQIHLQTHGSEVRFRNLRVRELE